MANNKETVVFGGGCFWCTEAVFKMLKGVLSVDPGYAGGSKQEPTYKEVSTGTTGHAEVVKIEYDPKIISFDDLLTVFFATHDPTQINRQGNDIGKQYRSVILYTTEEQKKEAENFIKKLNESSKKGQKIATEVKILDKFYSSEKYHKDFYALHKGDSYCQAIINPKLEKVKEKFSELLNNG
jgi:peptide-methionine (S)-S-oxide reductase